MDNLMRVGDFQVRVSDKWQHNALDGMFLREIDLGPNPFLEPKLSKREQKLVEIEQEIAKLEVKRAKQEALVLKYNPDWRKPIKIITTERASDA